MKNINKLFELLEDDYNVYFSSNATFMEKYINHLKNFKGLVEMENPKDEKILVFAFLTTNKKIETEIIVSNEFLVKDHRSAGASNNAPCTTVFVKCQDIQLKKAMQELQSIIFNF